MLNNQGDQLFYKVLIFMKNFEKAIGQIPSGLFIVCTLDSKGKKLGFLASWVQQASFHPLLISLAIKNGRPGYDHIVTGKPFSINIVAEEKGNFLKHFWNGTPAEKDPFELIAHKVSKEGTIWIEEAKAVIDCVFKSKAAPGDHEIIFAEVVGGMDLNSDLKSKTYTRKSGMDY